jgi:hypothetical protein
LRPFLLGTRIVFCEFKDEIIQCAPQVVADLSDQDRNAYGGRNDDGNSGFDCVRSQIRVRIDGSNIVVLLKRGDALPQIKKMFSCACCSFESTVEYVWSHKITALLCNYMASGARGYNPADNCRG